MTVTGITIQNSPQTHLKFDDCTNVQVSGVSILSPGNSPNTDGIHLQNSQDVAIYGSNLACGNFHILVSKYSFGEIFSSKTGKMNESLKISFFFHNHNCILQEMTVYPYKLDAQTYTYTILTVDLDMGSALEV